MRVVTITDNHLGGGLETRIQVCLRGAAAHLILAERTALEQQLPRQLARLLSVYCNVHPKHCRRRLASHVARNGY
ncbi:MAG: hypothetical protein AAFR79_21225 [Pseudomonadota bacterium]